MNTSCLAWFEIQKKIQFIHRLTCCAVKTIERQNGFGEKGKSKYRKVRMEFFETRNSELFAPRAHRKKRKFISFRFTFTRARNITMYHTVLQFIISHCTTINSIVHFSLSLHFVTLVRIKMTVSVDN